MLKYHIYPNLVNACLSILPNSKGTNKIRKVIISIIQELWKKFSNS